MTSNFWRLSLNCTQVKNFLRGWLLVSGLEEGLVECATLFVKSWVILNFMYLCKEGFRMEGTLIQSLKTLRKYFFRHVKGKSLVSFDIGNTPGQNL